jgi:hypothetical protein
LFSVATYAIRSAIVAWLALADRQSLILPRYLNSEIDPHEEPLDCLLARHEQVSNPD